MNDEPPAGLHDPSDAPHEHDAHDGHDHGVEHEHHDGHDHGAEHEHEAEHDAHDGQGHEHHDTEQHDHHHGSGPLDALRALLPFAHGHSHAEMNMDSALETSAQGI